MPAWAVTSTNSIGPLGRGGLGLGEGDGVMDASVDWEATGAFEEVLVQAEKKMAAPKTKIKGLSSKLKVLLM